MTNKQKEAGSDPGLLLLYFRHRPRRRTISTPRLVDSIFHRGDYWMPAFAGMTTQEFCHAHDVSFSWDWNIPEPVTSGHPRAPLSFHVAAQFPDAPFAKDGQAAIKFNSFWTIELEPGWSLFATHPVNRDDLPFRLISGLVDSDRFHDGGINFPAIWTRPDFSGVLPRGTPVAQCFAVPREAPELDFECI